MVDASSQVLLRRFTGRLNRALDAIGAPANPLDRARFFGAAIHMDTSHVSGMLNGFVMPDWDVLAKICAATNRQPGFFLDETVADLPPNVRVVKPLGSGDPIVVRVPSSDAAHLLTSPKTHWRYMESRRPMGFGVIPGDIVIDTVREDGTVELETSALYLMQSASGFDLLKCTNIAADTFTFSHLPSGADRLISTSIPFDKQGGFIAKRFLQEAGVEHFGKVAMSQRPAGVMRNL
jgi:transcriptional regulator with XRE-family HTH domain